jgi:hypothetical protein
MLAVLLNQFWLRVTRLPYVIHVWSRFCLKETARVPRVW